MEEEPQLDAWVGDCEIDANICGEINGRGVPLVFVSVEDTPDLVVRTPSASASISCLVFLGVARVLYEGQRITSEVVNSDQYIVAVQAMPVFEVLLLSLASLDEDQKL